MGRNIQDIHRKTGRHGIISATDPRHPHVTWPNGVRVAINIVLNYEEGAEYSWLEDGKNDKLGRIQHSQTARGVARSRNGDAFRIWFARRHLASRPAVRSLQMCPSRCSGCAVCLGERIPRCGRLDECARPRSSGSRVALAGIFDRQPGRRRAAYRRKQWRSTPRVTGQRPLGWNTRSYPQPSIPGTPRRAGGWLPSIIQILVTDDLPYFHRS